MKLKIIESGWGNFTGNFGTVDFVDGVSVDPVSPIIAQRLASLIQIETIAEGDRPSVNPSVTQILIDSRCVAADVDMVPPTLTTDAGFQVFQAGEDGKPYTRPQLEAIASAKGIDGLRAIGEPAGLKGTKIVGLIEAILKAGVVDPASVVKKVAGDDTTRPETKKGPITVHISDPNEMSAPVRQVAPPVSEIVETE